MTEPWHYFQLFISVYGLQELHLILPQKWLSLQSLTRLLIRRKESTKTRVKRTMNDVFTK